MLPNNDTRLWTADEGKILCEGQQGWESSQKVPWARGECELPWNKLIVVAIHLPMMASKLGLQMFLFAFRILLNLWSTSSVSTFLWMQQRYFAFTTTSHPLWLKSHLLIMHIYTQAFKRYHLPYLKCTNDLKSLSCHRTN